MNILEVEILTENLVETAKFYGELLGFHSTKKDKDSISFVAGQSILTFIQSNGLNPTYHFAFNIPNNKINEAVNWVSARCDLIKSSDNGIIANFESWNAKAFYFYDNNKNILEFITRFDLNNYSDNRFEASSIQSISEIGIVTDDPISYAADLITHNNLSYFQNQPVREHFVVLGNDEGLFVIAKTGRNWYPTDRTAGKYFSKIRYSINDLTSEITVNNQHVKG
jgi:hypothetical protein